MATTVINEFTIEPKAAPPSPEQSGGGGAGEKGTAKDSPDTAREIERLLRREHHRHARLWAH
ncbi:MAG TPA: hypothetical protein VNN08_06315 [Thermoanaerobaculia bacterium]|nr:hypothetical protein [Thermoanaerobaculia bacterium]